MFIHQDFRDELKNIRPDLQTKFGLTNVDALPDDVLVQILHDIFSNQAYPLVQKRLISDTGSNYYIYLILDKDNLKSIDDTFLWMKDGLYRWAGLTDLINTIEEELNEGILFKPGKIVRVCANDKLRTLDLQNLRDYTGRHFKVMGYASTTFTTDEMINSLYSATRYRKVYCEDGFGNKYVMPQCILVPTSIKDLKAHEEKIQLEKILYRLNDTAKYDLEKLSDEYADKLREFMESSKRLQQKMTRDFTEEAKQILDMQLNFKDKIKKNAQVAAVTYVLGKQIIFETTPIRCTDPEEPDARYPMGRYKCEINLVSRDLKIFNIDIGNRSDYQHPHIQGSGTCCLGDRVNPLRDSYSKQDRVTLVGGIIAYLEHLNPRSVYRSMADFQSKNSKVFQYQLDNKPAPVEGNKETPEVVDLTMDDESASSITFNGTSGLVTDDSNIITLNGAGPQRTTTVAGVDSINGVDITRLEERVAQVETHMETGIDEANRQLTEAQQAMLDAEARIAQADSDRIDAEIDADIDLQEAADNAS